MFTSKRNDATQLQSSRMLSLARCKLLQSFSAYCFFSVASQWLESIRMLTDNFPFFSRNQISTTAIRALYYCFGFALMSFVFANPV